MKTSFFIVALLFLAMSSAAQEPTVKIKINDEERFRFEADRFEIVNPLHNVLIGDSCGWNINGNPDAVRNVFIGYQAGYHNTSGYENVFIGDSSGYDNTEGYLNAAVGSWSAWKNTTGRSNAFFGGASGAYNTKGHLNSYFGTFSGYQNDTGIYNCFHGYAAGALNHGSNNVFVGGSAGRYNKGDSSVMIGFRAGQNDTASNKLYISNSETDKPLVYGEFDTKMLLFNASRLEIRNPAKNTIIGDSAGTRTLGARNTFIGERSGYWNTDGHDNVFVGDSAGYENTTGNYNVFSGNWAGWKNTTGNQNVFLGLAAGMMNTEGNANVFIGERTGWQSTTGSRNAFVGTNAGFANTSGIENTYLGTSAGARNTTGSCNTFLGRKAGLNNLSGDSSVFIGFYAGAQEMASHRLYIANSDTTTPLIYGEFDNELLRVHGKLDIKGIYQFPIVDGAGGQVLKTDGSGSLSWSGDVGATDINGLSDGKTGGYSVFLGPGAGANDNGFYTWNVAVGHTSLLDNVSGVYNTAIGGQSLMKCVGSYNTATGYQALYNNTIAGYNTATGVWALFKNESGGYNCAFGYGALYSNVSGYYNTANGENSLYFNTASFNTGCGFQSLYKNTSGERNTAVGVAALLNNTTGNYNIAVGNGALTANLGGHGNIAIGHMANYYNQNGSYNTILGYEAGKATAVHNKSGNVFIGYQAGYSETGNNKLYIENSDTVAPLIYGDFENDTLRVNGTFDINHAFHFPLTDGTAGQVLQTDGSGAVTWASAGGDFSDGGEAGGADRSLGNTDNYDLNFLTNNTSRLNINNDGGIRLDGKVGIFTDPASPGINNSIKLYDAETWSNPYLEISGHNTAYIYLQSRRTGNTNGTSGKTWSIGSGSGSVLDLDKFFIYNPNDGVCFTIRSGGKVGIGPTDPTARLDVSGTTGYDQFRMRTSYTPTSSSDTNGNTGDVAWDDSFLYVKTSTGWKRAALEPWP